MVDLLAAAGLQLRLHAGRPRHRRLVGHEEARLRAAAAGLQADPHAEEHRHGRHPGRAQHRARLRADLVHLVAGRSVVRRVSSRSRSSTPSTTTATIYIPAEDVVRIESHEHRNSREEPEAMHETTPPPGATAPVFYDEEEHAHGEGGTLLGFWIYLMSDCLIFAVLFATYRRARPQLCGGPVGRRSVRPAAGRGQHRACCCCRRSPTALPCWRCSKDQRGLDAGLAGGHRPVRRRLRRHRALRVRTPDP